MPCSCASPRWRAPKLDALIASVPACTIGIEACSGTHHWARQGLVEQRTATLNRIRGVLSEFGILSPLKAELVRCEARNHIEDLPGQANTVIGDLLSEASHRRITKAGDAYLRGLLVLGARAVLNAAPSKTDSLSRWAMALRERRGYWSEVLAIAAKNARMAWAVLTNGESFKLPA